MDHILQLRVEHQSSAKLCDRGIVRFTRSADASLVTLTLAAIAFLALFLSLSPFSVAGSPSSSTLPARLVAVVGSIFTSKTALFVLSNIIFILLAADCRCCFATTASAGHAASSGKPAGGVLEKQARHHQVQVEVEQCGDAGQSSVPCSESLDDHNEQEAGEDKSTMSANALPDEEHLPKLELVRQLRLGEEEEEGSITLEEIVPVDVEEPTCEAAQGLDRLEISELNKKFDEFISSSRSKWVKEEACLLLYEV